MSPFQKWLRTELNTTHRQFGIAAGVSGALVQAVAAGDRPMMGKLREYVLSLRADVVDNQDRWFEMHQKNVRRDIAEAAA